MKTLIYLFFVFLFLVGGEAKAVQSQATKAKVSLSTDGSFPILRSSVEPIEAYVDETSLDIIFQPDMGIIYIYIYNEANELVLQLPMNTSVQQEISVDMLTLDSGEYSIEFIGIQNQYLYGNFEITE